METSLLYLSRRIFQLHRYMMEHRILMLMSSWQFCSEQFLIFVCRTFQDFTSSTKHQTNRSLRTQERSPLIGDHLCSKRIFRRRNINIVQIFVWILVCKSWPEKNEVLDQDILYLVRLIATFLRESGKRLKQKTCCAEIVASSQKFTNFTALCPTQWIFRITGISSIHNQII